MKDFLNRTLLLLIFFSVLKGSLLIFTLVHDLFINNNANINRPTNLKNKLYTKKTIEKKIPVSTKVFQIKNAQAAEAESKVIPKPMNKLVSKQWEKLRAKEAELKRKERALKELEAKIDKKLEEEKKLAKKLEELIQKADVLKDKKIKHLVNVYSNMEPARAAKVLETLDKELAVKILAGMKGRIAGEILTNMDPKKAAALSEALTAFQTPFGK